MSDIVLVATNLTNGDPVVIDKLQSVDNVIIYPTVIPEPDPPSSPYNLLVVGEATYNPLTWDFDGSDPDYFLLEFTHMTNPYATERGYTNNSSGIPYDAKSDSTWYIPGNLRLVYVTYGDFGNQYKLRLFAETGGVLSDASNVVDCYVTIG